MLYECKANRSEVLAEAVPEALKNVLLVMAAQGVLTPSWTVGSISMPVLAGRISNCFAIFPRLDTPGMVSCTSLMVSKVTEQSMLCILDHLTVDIEIVSLQISVCSSIAL